MSRTLTPARNILRVRPGFMSGVNPETPRAAFLLYFDEILDDIVYCTNLEARRYVVALHIRSRLRKNESKQIGRKLNVFWGCL